MIRTRVKICGITRPEDGRLAALAGADAIGLVFYERSPRAVTLEQARAIIARLPPFVATVGLFVNAAPARVREVLAACPLDLLQFHGDETPDECRRFGRPYIKAIRMHPSVDLVAAADAYGDARGLLLDAWRADSYGGTGECFDWRRIPDDLPLPIILAGGLSPANVAEAIAAVRPYAVDLSSGVEEKKGIKSAARVQALMRGVESARER